MGLYPLAICGSLGWPGAVTSPITRTYCRAWRPGEWLRWVGCFLAGLLVSALMISVGVRYGHVVMVCELRVLTFLWYVIVCRCTCRATKFELIVVVDVPGDRLISRKGSSL